MLMYRYENNIENRKGIVTGLGLRSYGTKTIISAEVVYDNPNEEFGFTAYLEAYVIPNIIIFASYGRDTSSIESNNDYVFKPGVKWNLSESKK